VSASTAADTIARCCCSSRRLRILRKTLRDADLKSSAGFVGVVVVVPVSKKDPCVFEFSCKLGFDNLLKILLF
jgi:hypothetical protein